uniref:Uncharacterized protein n=1 Tax=Panagrellus redivivus TaxID=6233 RepID=A0A7E4VZR1_PANRE
MTQQERVQFYRMYEDSREMLNLIAQSKPVVPRKESSKTTPRKTSATRAQYRRASDASPELFQLREDDSRFACNRVISNAQTSSEVNPKHRRRSQSDAGIQRKTTPSPQDISTHSRRLIKALKENPAESVDISLPKDIKLRRGSAPASQILSTVKEEPEEEIRQKVDTINEENEQENTPHGRKMSIRQKLSVFFKGGGHSSAQRA